MLPRSRTTSSAFSIHSRRLLAGFVLGAAPAFSQVVSSQWVGHPADGSGLWSQSGAWIPNQVPDNFGSTVFDVTVAQNPNGNFYNGNGPILDVNATVRNLTLVDAVLIENQALPTPTNLTVTGTTTFTTTPNGTGLAGIVFNADTGTFSLGTLTNYIAATKTLEGAGLNVANGGIVQFRGADIVTNNGNIYVGGAGSRILNQNNGASALTNLAVNNGVLQFAEGFSFNTVGNFTNNGSVIVGTIGNNASIFTINGALTNFDTTTKTLTGGLYNIDTVNGPGAAILRFAGADIRTLSGVDLHVNGAGAAITDLLGNDAFRNLSRIENNTIFRIGPRTFTPTAGTLELSSNSALEVSPGSTSTVQGNVTVQSGGSIRVGAPAPTSHTSVIVNGSAQINGGSIDMGGQPGVNTLYTSQLTVADGLTFSGGSVLTGTGTTYADIALLNGAGLSPGHSPGKLDVVGAITFGAGTFLKMEIGGVLPGTQFAVLDHEGPGLLTLGGVLQLSLIDGFFSSISSVDVFEIVTSDHLLAGAFENVASGARLTTTDGLGSFVVTYAGTDGVTLSNFQPVPEPSAAGLLLTAGAGLLVSLRRRRAA